MNSLAFLKNINPLISIRDLFLFPIVNSNKAKWKNLESYISVIDFDNIQYDVWNRHYIANVDLEKLSWLMSAIKSERDEINFKTICFDSYKRRFNKMYKLYRSWIDFLIPYWETDIRLSRYKINKGAFYIRAYNSEDFNTADEQYTEHLQRAHDLILSIQKEFKKIKRLANREAYELLLPWRWY